MKLGVALISIMCVACTTPSLTTEQANRLWRSSAIDSRLAAAMATTAVPASIHNGPVNVVVEVWTLYSGDGSLPSGDEDRGSEGDMYPQWFYRGEKSLAEVRTDPIVKNFSSVFDPNGDPLSNPIARDDFPLYPSDSDLEVVVRVYDQDEIGSSNYEEVSMFLQNVGAQASNLYPANKAQVPILQELLKLVVLDLPNLFLANDTLGTIRTTVHRTKDGTTTGERWIEENYLAARITVTPQ